MGGCFRSIRAGGVGAVGGGGGGEANGQGHRKKREGSHDQKWKGRERLRKGRHLQRLRRLCGAGVLKHGRQERFYTWGGDEVYGCWSWVMGRRPDHLRVSGSADHPRKSQLSDLEWVHGVQSTRDRVRVRSAYTRQKGQGKEAARWLLAEQCYVDVLVSTMDAQTFQIQATTGFRQT